MQRATRHEVIEAIGAVAFLLLVLAASAAAQGRLQSSDFLKLRSVGAVQWSPDGTRIAYTVTSNDRPGGPYAQLGLLTEHRSVDRVVRAVFSEALTIQQPTHFVEEPVALNHPGPSRTSRLATSRE
jgi:hypothetical protein